MESFDPEFGSKFHSNYYNLSYLQKSIWSLVYDHKGFACKSSRLLLIGQTIFEKESLPCLHIAYDLFSAGPKLCIKWESSRIS